MLKKLLFLSLVLLLGFAGGFLSIQVLRPTAPVYVNQTKEVRIQENQALSEAVSRVSRAVIVLQNRSAAGLLEGSAAALTNDGLVVTLAELAPSGSQPAFFAANQSVKYQILKRDAKLNLVLVKIEAGNLPSLNFGDDPAPGQTVFLVGARRPGLLSVNFVNAGLVRSLSGGLFETNIFEKSWLAGSPLFDVAGNLVGLVTIGKDGRVSAIPASVIKSFAGL